MHSTVLISFHSHKQYVVLKYASKYALGHSPVSSHTEAQLTLGLNKI